MLEIAASVVEYPSCIKVLPPLCKLLQAEIICAVPAPAQSRVSTLGMMIVRPSAAQADLMVELTSR